MNTDRDMRRAFRAGAEKAEAGANEMALVRIADALEKQNEHLEWIARNLEYLLNHHIQNG